MIKHLIKSTQEIRVSTEDAADALHKQMAQEAEEIGATLSSWTETLRNKKSKGEIIESWVIVKYTLTFDDPKDPMHTLESIEYNID